MFLDKYEPKSTREFVGNREQLEEIRKWLRSWNGVPLFVWGPVGCGKSLAIKLIAREMGFDVMESHASDMRDKQGIEDMISSSKQTGVFSKKRIIVIEDMEMMESKAMLTRLVKESMQPIVMIAENPYDLGIPAVVKASKLVKFSKADSESVNRYLRGVCAKEDMKIDPVKINSIVLAAEGDIRSALIDLEMSSSVRERSANIYDVVRSVFRGEKKFTEDTDMNTLIFWMSENIPAEFRQADEIAHAYDCLSRSDIFMSRIIKRQSWGLQKYVRDMIFNGIPLSKKNRKVTFSSYRPPVYHARPSMKTLQKIAPHVHVSAKEAVRYLPVMKTLVRNRQLVEEMDLDEDDVEFIRSFR